MRRTSLLAVRRRRSTARLVDRLATAGGRVGVGDLLGDLDRRGEHAEVPGEAAGRGFTWDETDRADRRWWPQGVACLRGADVLLVSWYAKRDRLLRSPGTRITLVDRSHADAPRYRHVLLVAPRRWPGTPPTRAVRVHAGGIAVVGDVLYVADTLMGVRVFRLADVLRAPARRSAAGHDVVLPQAMALRAPLGLSRLLPWRRGAPRRLRFSFLSVGRADDGPTLVVGEYCRAAERPPRLVRYALDPGSGLPVTDDRGRAVPLAVHEDQPRRMQGAAVHGPDWFVTASAGPEKPGDLYTGAPGAWVRHRGVLPPGPEDLDWSRPGEELWCVSEWPGRRWVFPVATGRWRGSPEG